MPPRCDKLDLCISTGIWMEINDICLLRWFRFPVSWFMVPLITVDNDNQTESQAFMNKKKNSWLIRLLKTKDFFLFNDDNVCADHFTFSEAKSNHWQFRLVHLHYLTVLIWWIADKIIIEIDWSPFSVVCHPYVLIGLLFEIVILFFVSNQMRTNVIWFTLNRMC